MKSILLWYFLFFGLIHAAWAQRSLSGRVTTAAGEALPGVTVRILGTSTGTLTDLDGNYRIEVRGANNALQFSFLGYADQLVTIENQSILNIVLTEEVEELREVVVTAQGFQREKRALGYVVSSVSGRQLEQQAEPDLSRILKGKVPGVNITSTSGVSGTGTNIIIRGYSSFSGSNQPLFIVDGVPFNANTNVDNSINDFLEGGQASTSRFLDLDPNNIESLSVLKGLSATVIYGEQGRNGVILITTKNASAPRKDVSITLNQSLFQNEIASLPEYTNNWGVGYQQNFGWFFSNWGPHFSTRGTNGVAADGTVPHPFNSLPLALRNQFPEYQGARYEFKPYQSVENFFRKGLSSNTSLNLSGGTDDISLSGSFGYTSETGFVPGNDLKKLNIGIGGNAKLSNKLSLNSSLNFAETNMRTPPISYGSGSGLGTDGTGVSIFADVLYTPRSVDLMGLPFESPVDHRSVYYRSGNDLQNPRWTAKYTGVTSDVRRFFGKTSLSYQLSDKLNLLYRLGLDTYTENQTYFMHKGGVANPVYSGGLYRTAAINNTLWNHDIIANFSHNFNETLSLSALLGVNARQDLFARDGLESTQQIVFGFLEHSNFTSHSSVNSFSGLDIQSRSEENLVAAYAQLMLGYKDYLYLNLSGRNDWSSTLEKEHNAIFYPSASVSFVPTDAFEGLSSQVLNYLKLRVGWGTSAGFPAPYSTRSSLSSTGRAFVTRDGSVITSNGNATYFPNNGAGAFLGNPNLKPELHKELEVGLETRMFKNRLGLEATVYRRITEDLITTAPLDPATGYTATSMNIGEIENKGLELALEASLLALGDFRWSVAANGTAYKTLVNALGAGLEEVNIAGFSNLGNFAVAGEAFNIMKGTAILRNEAGVPIISNNGYYQPTDALQIIGDPNPDFTSSLMNTFSWKGLSLGMQWEYRHGGDFYSGTAAALLARGVTKDTDFDRQQAFVLEGVTEEGEPNTVMITPANLYFDNTGFGPDERAVYDGTTVRLRELSLSYQLPALLMSKTPFKRASISLLGNNLWYKALYLPKYTHVDTDALGLGAGGNGLGFEFVNGPSARRYGFSLQIGF